MEMDNLARDAILARKAGMTYGRWKAKQKPEKVEKKEIPEGWKVCPQCGKPFKPAHGKEYCNNECRIQAYAPKANERYKEYMARKRGQKDVKCR